jgi:hypothetical protein
MGRGACPHVGKLGLLISFVVLAIGACGGEAEPLSEEFGSLPPSRDFGTLGNRSGTRHRKLRHHVFEGWSQTR